jgi:hypothetical protein
VYVLLITFMHATWSAHLIPLEFITLIIFGEMKSTALIWITSRCKINLNETQGNYMQRSEQCCSSVHLYPQ